MSTLTRLFFITMTALLCGVLIVPTVAQEGGGAGQGGVIIEPTIGDVATLNPLLVSDTGSATPVSMMFPSLITIDPATAEWTPGAPGGLATDWTISEDGTVYTITLRDDYTWNDGTPITSADYKYAFDAIASKEVDTPLNYVLDVIKSVEAPDPQTVVVTLHNADCSGINNIAYVPVVPAHKYQELFPSYADMNDSDYNLAPSVTGGIFQFGEYRPAEQLSLLANQTYPDAFDGYVSPEGWIYKNVPDATVMIEQFKAGLLDVLDAVPSANRKEMRELAAQGKVQLYEYSDNVYFFIKWNLADPTNPQDGLDENGNVIDQGHHPLFGDVRVRQALARAVDVDAIIQGALFGEGTHITSYSSPSSWAYADLPPIPFDPEEAKQMLADAGWRDEDGDGVLEAHDALYAEDGTPFRFTLISQSGSRALEAIVQVFQDQLRQVGVDVEIDVVDFNISLQLQDSQEYDAAVAGWSLAYPDDPDGRFAFGPENDIVGSGFNNNSYYNPAVLELWNQARRVPDCDQAARAELYRQAQEILVADQPYLLLHTPTAQYVAQSWVQGFAPYPNALRWNIDTWVVARPE